MTTRDPYRPIRYFTSVFLVTSSLWFAGAYASHSDDLNKFYTPLMLIGLLAPFLISLIMVLISGAADLKRDYINRLVNVRLIKPGFLLGSFLIMPLAVMLSIGISIPFGGSVSQFQLSDEFSFSYGVVPVLMILLLAAVFEELGWRGYAFDSLQSRFKFLTAALLFGIAWSLWHFPLIFVKNSYQYEIMQQSIWYGVNFFVGIIPMGIIISWICVKNEKSVIAAILFHFMVNLSQEMLAITQTTKCIETGVLFVFAWGLTALDRDLFFS